MEVWQPGPSHHVPWDLADLCQAAGLFVFFSDDVGRFGDVPCFDVFCAFFVDHLVACFEGKKVSMYVFVDIHTLGRGIVYI